MLHPFGQGPGQDTGLVERREKRFGAGLLFLSAAWVC